MLILTITFANLCVRSGYGNEPISASEYPQCPLDNQGVRETKPRSSERQRGHREFEHSLSEATKQSPCMWHEIVSNECSGYESRTRL